MAATRERRSSRSAWIGRARPPADSISRAVVSRLPGMRTPGAEPESSKASPSRTVRAVIATSNPAVARAMADALPIPRLAPVTERDGSVPGHES